MLTLDDVHAGYDGAEVLFGMTLSVGAGEVVALMGRNGMGKTTTVRTIFGALRATSGQIVFQGQPIARAPIHRIARRGLGLVPEGRGIFVNLTVRENLLATARPRKGEWTLDRVHALFPRLDERAGNLGHQLSGGEQQMLAIGRALLTNPSLLVLDEATEGLAPIVRDQIWGALAAVRARGQSILVIDKHLTPLLQLADRFAIVEKGRVVWEGTAPEVEAQRADVVRYLGA